MSDPDVVVVEEAVTEIVEVIAEGPKGDKGDKGDPGDAGSGGGIDEGEAQALVDAAVGAEQTAREGADAVLTAAASAEQSTADAALPKAGGTMTGALTLAADPTAALHAATRQFVLAQIAALVNGAPGALDTLNELAAALAALEASDAAALEALAAVVAGKLAQASNLADLADAAAARGNLGLGSAATHDAADFEGGGLEATWEDASLAESVSSFGAPYAPKVRAGVAGTLAFLTGLASLGANKPAGSVLFTLPAAARPAYKKIVQAIDGNNPTSTGTIALVIEASGQVKAGAFLNSGQIAALDGISYSLDH